MVSPATKSVLPPDNVPEAYRASSTLQAPTVILVGEPGRDDWSPAEKVEWASIKRGRDNTPTTASLTASLSVDDLGAAGSIGGRHFYHLLNEFGPNTLVRIFQAGADEQGRDDYPLFEGWPVAVPIRSDPRNQTIDFELTDRAFVAMDGDERAQVTGQFLRRNRLATWKPWRPNHVRIEARPVVFNEGGRPNRSAEHYRYRGDTYPKPKPQVPILLAERIPLFTDVADKSARYWTVCDALVWLLWFHCPEFINFDDFLADARWLRGVENVASADPFVRAMTQRLPETPCSSVDLNEALAIVCGHAGLHFTRELGNVDGTWTHWLRFFPTGRGDWSTLRRMPMPKSVDLPRDPPFTPAGQRRPHDRIAANAAQVLSLTVDDRVVNQPIVLGAEKRYEVTLYLLPGWLPFPTAEAYGDGTPPDWAYKHYVNADPAIGPVLNRLVAGVPKTSPPAPEFPVTIRVLDNVTDVQDALDWWETLRLNNFGEELDKHPCLQFHTAHPLHALVGEVGRLWTVIDHASWADLNRNAAGQSIEFDVHSKYHRSYYANYNERGPYPWDVGFNFAGAGIANAESWARLPRPFLDPISLNPDGSARSPKLEIRFGSLTAWQELTAFQLLRREGAVLITEPNLTSIRPLVPPDNPSTNDGFIKAIIEHRLEVRITCTIEGDERVRDSQYTPGWLQRRHAQVFDVRDGFRFDSRRGQNSIFNSEPKLDREPWLPADAAVPGEGYDDTEPLQAYADQLVKRLGRRALSGNPEIPWLDYSAIVGDEVGGCYGLALFFYPGAEVIGIEHLNGGESGPRTRWLLSDTREE